MSSILESRDYYKPFQYPWAYTAFKVARSMMWEPHEVVMTDDLKDWASRLTQEEREFLTQLFRFFTQADLDIARGYVEKYMPRFKHPELRMMMSEFASAEANHIDAYATLIETLGLPESDFKAFQGFKAMREKHEYMFEHDTSNRSIADLIVDIACFSAFGEGMQLFSSFALLMNFQRRGLMKGMTTIVEWSIRDETHHVESMIKVFHALVEENSRAWNDETKKRIYDTCRKMVKLEDHFIDQAMSFGPVEGVTPEEAKRYIRYIADRRLLQLGLKPNYHVKENPFPWLDWIMNAPTHTNFFEQRSTEYGKGEIAGWDKAFDFLDRDKSAQGPKQDGCAEDAVCMISGPEVAEKPVENSLCGEFRVYSKPSCPHCARAKQVISAAGFRYDEIMLELPETRADVLELVKKDWGIEWKSFPVIFDHRGENTVFVGGADAVTALLKGSD